MESSKKSKARPVDFMIKVENPQGRMPYEWSPIDKALNAVNAIKEKCPDAQIHVEMSL